MPPEQRVQIGAGPYRAEVSEVGAALTDLRFGHRTLVHTADDRSPWPRFRGAILAPWPNRIAAGRYQIGGRTQQLPINEVERATALHGLALYDSWRLVDASPTTATLTTMIWPQPGYPFTLALTARYRLSEADGLSIAVTARNDGSDVAPYGVSIHPYLRAGPGSVDEWTLQIPAAGIIDVDPIRLLPRAALDARGGPFDFIAPRPIGPTAIDHAYTAISFDDDVATASITAADGSGVRISWDQSCQWVQVHTTDLPGDASHRQGLAVEPMTCPPDAFNSGQGVLHLQPAQTNRTHWQISAI